MSFEDYLISKKIDSSSFAKEEPARFQEWKNIFEQVSPESFTSRKLYLINPLRRRFSLKQIVSEKKSELSKPISKPIIKPKIN